MSTDHYSRVSVVASYRGLKPAAPNQTSDHFVDVMDIYVTVLYPSYG